MTSRILAALLALTGGLPLGALLPLGFAVARRHDQDYRTGTLGIAHTLAAAAEERIAGLGLAIVHRLITADGGTAELSDTPGGGTTVVPDLPATSRRRSANGPVVT